MCVDDVDRKETVPQCGRSEGRTDSDSWFTGLGARTILINFTLVTDRDTAAVVVSRVVPPETVPT